MQVQLIALFLSFNLLVINAAETDESEERSAKNNKQMIVAPGRFPKLYSAGLNSTFLPLKDDRLARSLFFTYQNPENMRLPNGDIVCSPFSSFKLPPDTFTWCLISRNGIFGHITAHIPPEGDTIKLNIIATIEIVKETSLTLEVVKQFINSSPFYKKSWSISAYSGNSYLRELLESAGFSLTLPVSIIAKYTRPSNAEIDGKTESVRFTYSGKEARF